MLKKKIQQYNITEISKKLKLSRQTVNRWINEDNIDKHIKFIQLLQYLDIDIDEFIKKYHQD